MFAFSFPSFYKISDKLTKNLKIKENITLLSDNI